MKFLYSHKLLFQSISFVLLLIPSGVAGIIYLLEKFRGVEITMVSISILWFMLPPPIIGIALLIIIAIYGRHPMEIFDIEINDISFGTADTDGFPKLNSKRIVRLELSLNALPGKMVDYIALQISGNLERADRTPGYVSPGVTTGGYFYFEIPDKVKRGSHTVIVVAKIEDNGNRESKKYNIEVP